MQTTPMVQRFVFVMCALTSVAAAQSVPPRKGIPAIARDSNGSIVSIVMSDRDGKPIAQGSGFVVSRDGLIVTNYHVIAEGSSAVVKLPRIPTAATAGSDFGFGAFHKVEGILAFDKLRDIAIIKAEGQDFRALALGDSDRVQIGEEVVAIGNPLSLDATVSNGIISGLRTIKQEGGKYLQITAPISPGSSGGPLFNMTGEVVGITTMYLKGGENLNFAIPINDVKRLLLKRSARLQDLPDEVNHEETSNALNPEATPLQEQTCKERTAKFVRYKRADYDPDEPKLEYMSHFNPKSSTCYAESGFYFVAGKKYPSGRSYASSITINDAFSEGDRGPLYGEFMFHEDGTIIPGGGCHIYPRGRSDETPDIRCRSKEEFDDLALKYFGLTQQLPDSNTKIAASVPDMQHGTIEQYLQDERYCHRHPQNVLQFSGDNSFFTCQQVNSANEAEAKACKTNPKSQTELCKKILIYFLEVTEGHPPANVKMATTPVNGAATNEQFWEDVKYCYQNPSNYLQASDGEIAGCGEVVTKVEAALKQACEGKARKSHPNCDTMWESINQAKANRP